MGTKYKQDPDRPAVGTPGALKPWEPYYTCDECKVRITLTRKKHNEGYCDECRDGFDGVELDDGDEPFFTTITGDVCDTVFTDEDPTPWCHVCGAMEQDKCDCLPIAENN